jgi:hypothetical protein
LTGCPGPRCGDFGPRREFRAAVVAFADQNPGNDHAQLRARHEIQKVEKKKEKNKRQKAHGKEVRKAERQVQRNAKAKATLAAIRQEEAQDGA